VDCGIVVGIINNDDDEQCRKDRKSNNESQCVIAETLTLHQQFSVANSNLPQSQIIASKRLKRVLTFKKQKNPNLLQVRAFVYYGISPSGK
jgi:hypothetical protein